MNLFRKCVSGALALTLAAGVAGNAIAAVEDDGDVDVQIRALTPEEGGVLSVSISDLNFGSFEYSLSTRTPTGIITIDASDMRGTAEGWYVTLAGEDFHTNTSPQLTFGINNLTLPAGTVNHVGASSGHPTSALPVPGAASPVSIGGQTVLTAEEGTGAGIYQNQRPGTQLVIPGGTLVGQYESTLTVTIISGDTP